MDPIEQTVLASSREPDAVEQSIVYLSEQLAQFLYPKERVLLCFHDHQYGNISYLMEQAVLRCGGVPVLWNDDIRWINLLRLAFSTKAGCIIGPPLVILGLSKVARAKQTPLFLRNAVLASYPTPEWMKDGIQNSLDCQAWGCFNIGLDGLVCGFSCPFHFGVHLREDVYGAEIVDDRGSVLAPGETGLIRLYRKAAPKERFTILDSGVLDIKPCICGRTSPKIQRMYPGKVYDPDLVELGQRLQSWTSILDCRLAKGPMGLEIEIIYFPGERLPKLPTAAKLIMKPWEPEIDEPFWYFPLSGGKVYPEICNK